MSLLHLHYLQQGKVAFNGSASSGALPSEFCAFWPGDLERLSAKCGLDCFKLQLVGMPDTAS